MRSRKRFRRRAIIGGALAILIAVLVGSMLIPDYGDNRALAEPVGTQAANRIAQKNENAAVTAAAVMREHSARTARIADNLQDQQDRANADQPPL
jgi:hypothetical protein